MKMSKRVLTLVLSLVLCFSVCSSAFVVGAETECEHVAGRWVTVKEPVCTSDPMIMGVQKSNCTLCGEEMAREIGPHTPGEWEIIVPATCTQEGERIQKCTACLETVNTDKIPMHTYVEGWRTEPTCIKDGTSNLYCIECGDNETIRIPADGKTHRMGEWVVTKEATCTETGERQRVCLNKSSISADAVECTYVETEVIAIDENAHKVVDEWERLTDPTCDEEGSESNFCIECENTIIRAVPMHTDTYKEYDRKEATCSHEGISYVSCTGCGHESELTIACNDAHSYIWDVVEEPTCTSAGYKIGICAYNREHKTTQELPAIPHVAEEEWTVTEEATCTQGGKRVKYCAYENCDAIVESENTDPIPHVESEWKLESGSCEAGGTAVKVCVYPHYDENGVRVDYVLSRTTFVAGTHVGRRTVKVDSTCVNDGYTVAWCTVCMSELTDRTVIPASHKLPEEFIVAEESTCAKHGYQVKKCADCDYTETEELPLKNHTLITVKEAVDVSCLQDGSTAHVYCLGCDYVKVSEVIPATGHIDSDGDSYCDACSIYLTEKDGGVVTCGCNCHKQDTISRLIFKLINFFNKIFGLNQICECGALHYEGGGFLSGLFGKA